MTQNKHNHEQSDLDALREHLSRFTGQQYWRSLEELAHTKEFQERLHREFPQGASEWTSSISRRNFLKLMGASMALAGVVGCTRQPDEKILPYSNRPDYLLPGIPQYYATAMTMGGYATGLLVESHLGRPTKIEGNPDHPASLGSTDVFGQAAILTMYDPDRSKIVLRQGELSLWGRFVEALQTQLSTQRANNGAGIHILTETVTSPTLTSQIVSFLGQFPGAIWHQYEPFGQDNARAGAVMAFGEAVSTRYDLSQAAIILTLDADILGTMPGHLRYAREFAAGRRVWETSNQMNRLYTIESSPSITGSVADHRLAVRPGDIEGLTRLLAQQLGLNVAQTSGLAVNEAQVTFIAGLLSDLESNRGRCVVVAGESQPPAVHALVHAINEALGNVGSTVFHTSPVTIPATDGAATQLESLRLLNQAMADGQVQVLIIVDSNPVFTAPVDFNFAGNLARVPFTVHMGLYHDETAEACLWHIPATHFLEAWSDARAFDGTVSIIQPLIAPLYQGKTIHELFAALNGEPDRSSYDIVRGFWQGERSAEDFEAFWQTALHDGVIANSALAPMDVTATLENIPAPQEVRAGMQIAFQPSPSIGDGRFANNGWLQELPQPWTRLTWDNAALISPRTAVELLGLGVADINNMTPDDYNILGEANGQMVQLDYRGRTLEMPIWIVPGQANNTVTVYTGYGRTRAGHVGNAVGFDAYTLRTSEIPWFGPITVTPTRSTYMLVTTQDHHSMENRALVRAGTLQEYLAEPGFIGTLPETPTHPDRSLFQDLFPYEGEYSWGMVIDLNSCIGCNACVVACQAENNIPIVGKDEVSNGREMHWIRIDRYFGGSLEDPVLYQQPMACVQCELAPCELVCPVAATVHDHEGINNMVYNRCVGTRYCSNNCPYKVRRFNFFYYTAEVEEKPSLKLLQNPDVTVRARGVMEKCTYCIQRIKEATIPAKNENRVVADGEIIPACAQTCPTQAITFGNLNDPNSRVSILKRTNLLNYGVLEEFNFFPRTTHVGRLSNPNPLIGQKPGADYPRNGEPYGSEHEGESHGEEAPQGDESTEQSPSSEH